MVAKQRSVSSPTGVARRTTYHLLALRGGHNHDIARPHSPHGDSGETSKPGDMEDTDKVGSCLPELPIPARLVGRVHRWFVRHRVVELSGEHPDFIDLVLGWLGSPVGARGGGVS